MNPLGFGGVLRDIFLGVCLDPFKMQRFAFWIPSTTSKRGYPKKRKHAHLEVHSTGHTYWGGEAVIKVTRSAAPITTTLTGPLTVATRVVS